MKSSRKLKILHLTSHLDIGGISRYIQLLGREMGRQGHEAAVVSAGGGLEEEFRRDGFKIYRFSIRKKSILNPSLYFSLSEIKKLVKREKFDVIHAHTRVTQALAYFLRRSTGVPVVSTYHGYFKSNFGRKVLPFWGDRLVAISGPVAEDLKVAHRAPAERVRVVGNAIDLEASAKRLSEKKSSEMRQKFGIPPNATVLCYIARMVQDKGHEVLLRAMAQLLPSFPELFLLLAGDGREKENLRKVITELKLSNHVALVSNLADISEALCVTDIYVHPAFYREGFGLAIAEAMAAGRPVVITDIPAIHRIFKPGECSVMAQPGDVSSLSGAIRFLMEAPGERTRIAQAGQALVRSLCRLDRQADEMEAVYRELTGLSLKEIP